MKPRPPNYFKEKIKKEKLKKELDELHKKTTEEINEMRFNFENEISKENLIKMVLLLLQVMLLVILIF